MAMLIWFLLLSFSASLVRPSYLPYENIGFNDDFRVAVDKKAERSEFAPVNTKVRSGHDSFQGRSLNTLAVSNFKSNDGSISVDDSFQGIPRNHYSDETKRSRHIVYDAIPNLIDDVEASQYVKPKDVDITPEYDDSSRNYVVSPTYLSAAPFVKKVNGQKNPRNYVNAAVQNTPSDASYTLPSSNSSISIGRNNDFFDNKFAPSHNLSYIPPVVESRDNTKFAPFPEQERPIKNVNSYYTVTPADIEQYEFVKEMPNAHSYEQTAPISVHIVNPDSKRPKDVNDGYAGADVQVPKYVPSLYPNKGSQNAYQKTVDMNAVAFRPIVDSSFFESSLPIVSSGVNEMKQIGQDSTVPVASDTFQTFPIKSQNAESLIYEYASGHVDSQKLADNITFVPTNPIQYEFVKGMPNAHSYEQTAPISLHIVNPDSKRPKDVNDGYAGANVQVPEYVQSLNSNKVSQHAYQKTVAYNHEAFRPVADSSFFESSSPIVSNDPNKMQQTGPDNIAAVASDMVQASPIKSQNATGSLNYEYASGHVDSQKLADNFTFVPTNPVQYEFAKGVPNAHSYGQIASFSDSKLPKDVNYGYVSADSQVPEYVQSLNPNKGSQYAYQKTGAQNADAFHQVVDSSVFQSNSPIVSNDVHEMQQTDPDNVVAVASNTVQASPIKSQNAGSLNYEYSSRHVNSEKLADNVTFVPVNPVQYVFVDPTTKDYVPSSDASKDEFQNKENLPFEYVEPVVISSSSVTPTADENGHYKYATAAVNPIFNTSDPGLPSRDDENVRFQYVPLKNVPMDSYNTIESSANSAPYEFVSPAKESLVTESNASVKYLGSTNSDQLQHHYVAPFRSPTIQVSSDPSNHKAHFEHNPIVHHKESGMSKNATLPKNFLPAYNGASSTKGLDNSSVPNETSSSTNDQYEFAEKIAKGEMFRQPPVNNEEIALDENGLGAQLLTECSDENEGENLAVDVCRRYYVRCIKGDLVPSYCSDPHEVFSKRMNACVSKSAAPECKFDANANDNTFEGHMFCSNRRDGFYRHPTNCSRILQCFGHEIFEYPSCDSHLAFDESKELCDYRDHVVGCAISEETKGVASLFESKPMTSIDGCAGHKHGDHVANKGNCSTYYRCVWDRLVLMDCPVGTVFNPSLDVCDYPGEVPGCSKEVSSDSEM